MNEHGFLSVLPFFFYIHNIQFTHGQPEMQLKKKKEKKMLKGDEREKNHGNIITKRLWCTDLKKCASVEAGEKL